MLETNCLEICGRGITVKENDLKVTSLKIILKNGKKQFAYYIKVAKNL